QLHAVRSAHADVAMVPWCDDRAADLLGSRGGQRRRRGDRITDLEREPDRTGARLTDLDAVDALRLSDREELERRAPRVEDHTARGRRRTPWSSRGRARLRRQLEAPRAGSQPPRAPAPRGRRATRPVRPGPADRLLR